MKALPTRRYELSRWKKAEINFDYHVTFDDRHYSAPCELIGAAVYVRATGGTMEILHGGERVASHVRSFGPKGTYMTCEEHKPKSHRDYGKWLPAKMQAWADSIGPSSGRVVACILGRYRNPEFGFRAVLALTRDGRTFGVERLEAACARALIIAGPMGPTRRSVIAILRNKLEKGPLPSGRDRLGRGSSRERSWTIVF